MRVSHIVAQAGIIALKISAMSWEKEIEELRHREELAQRMGGPDKVKRQHDGGIRSKLLAAAAR